MKAIGLKLLVYGLTFFLKPAVWAKILEVCRHVEYVSAPSPEGKKVLALRSILHELRSDDLPKSKLLNLAIEIAALYLDPPK